jgi:predicted ATPase
VSPLREDVASVVDRLLAATGPAVSPGGLPSFAGAFVPRPHELESLGALLARDDVRLLTLTGAPGTGKTRLAIEAARAAAPSLGAGARFVDLAPVDDLELAAPTIAAALGIDAAGGSSDEALRSWLGERELLLVLDNLEQLPGMAAPLGELLDAAPGLTLLVTSRVPLHAAGEHVVEVEPLGRDEAVELFVARSRAVASGFALDRDAETVAEICRRLDGLPLALELAAAWVVVLSPAQILARLEHPLALLTVGAGDLAMRHRTLRATIGVSYDLLDPGERACFRRVAVFAGGWTLAAAEAVGAALPRLVALAEKRLVRVAADGDAPRFGQLETIRQYALERLRESDDLHDAADRHARFFLHLAERAGPEVVHDGRVAALHELRAEHANLRNALATFLRQGDSEEAMRMGTSLRHFWREDGHVAAGRRELERALRAPGAGSERARSAALFSLGVLARCDGDPKAGREASAAAVALARELEDHDVLAHGLAAQGSAEVVLGDLEGASVSLRESRALFLQLGLKREAAVDLDTLGYIAMQSGDLVTAAELLEESLTAYEEVGDRGGISGSWLNLGLLRLRLGDEAAAGTCYERALATAREIEHRDFVAYSLEGLAAVHAQARPEHAARLLGGAQRLRDELGTPRDPAEAELYAQTRERLEAGLEPDVLAAAMAAGAAIDWERLPG